jgi:hypothetical protein
MGNLPHRMPVALFPAKVSSALSFILEPFSNVASRLCDEAKSRQARVCSRRWRTP